MKPRLNRRQKKPLTIEQVEKRQQKAVQFAETFFHDDALADELRELTPEEYAERRGILIQNPQRREEVTSMADRKPSIQEQRDEAVDLLEEAQETLDDLQDRIDDVLGEYGEAEEEADAGNEE